MSARDTGWTTAQTAGGGRQRLLALALHVGKVIVVAVGLLAGSIGGWWGIVQYAGNIHAVSPGVLYRSAQLSGDEIGDVVHRYRIKSVLNLRGAHAGQAWYDGELAAAKNLGLAHYDYPLSAKRVVAPRQLAELLELVRRAPKPLLVHCRSGADRAGLVSALFRYEEGASATEADRQLSLLYGHFPYLMSRSVAMDTSFWAFVEAAPHVLDGARASR